MSYIRVQQFSLDGRFIGKTITDLPGPVGIATAPDGRILVTGYTVNKVYMLSVCFNVRQFVVTLCWNAVSMRLCLYSLYGLIPKLPCELI